jgi:hypothetical protein
MILDIYRKLKYWFSLLFGSTRKYTQISVAEIPSKLDESKIYIIGNKGQYWLALMKCPCGCGDTLHMNLLPSHRPCWKFVIDKNNTVSFKPSLWRKAGCQSHFFIQNGEVVWAK